MTLGHLILWKSRTEVCFTSRPLKLWTLPWKIYELLLESYGLYFRSLFLKTDQSINDLLDKFFLCNVSDLLKFLITSNLSMASPQITKLSAALLTIPTTSMSVMQSFSVLKRAHAYLHSTQTKEIFTKLTLMTDEKNSLRHAKYSKTSTTLL